MKRLEDIQERLRPKFAKLRLLKARGVIPYTVWNFAGKQRCEKCGHLVAIRYPHPSGLQICYECWRKYAGKEVKDGEHHYNVQG